MAQAYLSGAYTMQEIAEHFHVHYATVSRAVRRIEREHRKKASSPDDQAVWMYDCKTWPYTSGLIDNWLCHIKSVHQKNEDELLAIDNETDRIDRLCELNVIEQVNNTCHTTIV